MDFMKTLYMLPGIILGLSFHEFAHAQTAVLLGDDTPKYQERLTLSPLAHIDVVGFLMLLVAGFGWAKPVQINPNNFSNKKRDDILVSLAGPLANLIIAIFFLLLMKIIYHLPPAMLSQGLYEAIMTVFDYTVWINVVLFVFNFLPVPPLDGSHIFFNVLNLKDSSFYYNFYTKGRLVLLLLIVTDLLDKVISPPIITVYNSLFGLFFQ